eukprot:3586597-Prorocentrum_lima.AAC.1
MVKRIRSQCMSADVAGFKDHIMTKRRCTGSEDAGVGHQQSAARGHAERCIRHCLEISHAGSHEAGCTRHPV